MKSPPKLGLVLAGVHLALVIGIDLAIRISPDGQAPLLWVLLAIVDLPVSLVYLLASTGPVQAVAQHVYLPYLVHGLLGTLWWFAIPFVARRVARTFSRIRR